MPYVPTPKGRRIVKRLEQLCKAAGISITPGKEGWIRIYDQAGQVVADIDQVLPSGAQGVVYGHAYSRWKEEG